MRRAGWVARSTAPCGTDVRSLRVPARASNVTLARCVSRWVCRTNCRSTRVVVQKFAPGQFLMLLQGMFTAGGACGVEAQGIH
jgi:hypothetical protein